MQKMKLWEESDTQFTNSFFFMYLFLILHGFSPESVITMLHICLLLLNWIVSIPLYTSNKFY